MIYSLQFSRSRRPQSSQYSICHELRFSKPFPWLTPRQTAPWTLPPILLAGTTSCSAFVALFSTCICSIHPEFPSGTLETSRSFEHAERMLRGEVLYRDLFQFNLPGTEFCISPSSASSASICGSRPWSCSSRPHGSLCSLRARASRRSRRDSTATSRRLRRHLPARFFRRLSSLVQHIARPGGHQPHRTKTKHGVAQCRWCAPRPGDAFHFQSGSSSPQAYPYFFSGGTGTFARRWGLPRRCSCRSSLWSGPR